MSDERGWYSTRNRIAYGLTGVVGMFICGAWWRHYDHFNPESWDTWETILMYLVSGAVGLEGLRRVAGAVRGKRIG